VGTWQGALSKRKTIGIQSATLAEPRRVKLIGGRAAWESRISTGSVPYRNVSSRAFDADLNQLRMGLVQQVLKLRSRGVIVDVTAIG